MPILVVNPNSSPAVTAAIAEALRPLGPHFEVTQIDTGPDTIRTDADVAQAAERFAALAEARPDAEGFITACFSDPGLDLARARVARPVTGAQEAALLAAAAIGPFGIIALSARAIPRHLARVRVMGLADRLVAELPLSDFSAADSGHDPTAYAQILALGRELRGRGAKAIVPGCAGMAALTARLEADLGIRVVEPILAAGRLALARIHPEPPEDRS